MIIENRIIKFSKEFTKKKPPSKITGKIKIFLKEIFWATRALAKIEKNPSETIAKPKNAHKIYDAESQFLINESTTFPAKGKIKNEVKKPKIAMKKRIFTVLKKFFLFTVSSSVGKKIVSRIPIITRANLANTPTAI